jgi:hypothetical protein
MKRTAVALLLGASVMITSTAFAQRMNQDDLKWINQCIDDNRNEGARADVVRKYCVCMNEKMDNNETRSISEWEKANPRTRDACSREAGWR